MPGPGTGSPGTAWLAPGPAPAASWGPASPGARVSWEPPQAGANGCLRACLVVGVIGAGLMVVLVVAFIAMAGPIAQRIRDDPDAFFGGTCTLVSDTDLSLALGTEAHALALEGLADGWMGGLLDKRLLRDAPDCYILSQANVTGRIAVQEGNGAATFAAARDEASRFLLVEVDDVGDEAFCTELDRTGSGGILVRWGDRVAYVSVLDQGQDASGACSLARRVAELLGP